MSARSVNEDAEDKNPQYLEAVNNVRTASKLGLPKFTSPREDSEAPKSRDSQSPGEITESKPEPFEEELYEVTCDDLKESKISPAVSRYDEHRNT